MTSNRPFPPASFPQIGEVYWVNLPNQPNDPHQPRTAIVISPNGRNKSCNDIIVVPTTSSAKFRAHPLVHVLLPAGEGGLKRNSIVRCDQVTTIDKSLLGSGALGSPIGAKYQEQIIRGVRRAIADPTA
ncbi:MAG: type II toxin-antitoxin system PemK/MazF family toxin [Candidatus Melainabacteria bacterium]|nr:MAG: type II toxin-antitoxin system PemK/MazF family toxin [Candidatus Melainabacteria bacterium]